MELTKKILNVSIAISMVLLSISVFIYSVKDNKANAAPQMTSDGFVVAGVAVGERTVVIGYNPQTRQTTQLGEFRWDKH